MIRYKAFTLIELLIVVLIIAILAAIAVPNFLEFQTRAKVARVKSDFRAMATAIEAYYVDVNTYPEARWTPSLGWDFALSDLTTPIGYMSTIPDDPFTGTSALIDRYYEYGAGDINTGPSTQTSGVNDVWTFESEGPNREDDINTTRFPWVASYAESTEYLLARLYDPTNGTISEGNIYRNGGSPGGESAFRTWQALSNQ